MLDPQLIRRTQDFLFAGEEEMAQAGLRKDQRARLLRLRTLYAYWLRNPQKGDTEILSEARRLGSGDRQSYDDVRLLKICLGNLQSMTREWYQYLFIQRCEEGFALARRNGDAKAFASTLAALGKYTRLDHEELSLPDYSQIVPQELDFTDDPAAIGYERIPDVRGYIKRLERKFLGELQRVDDAEVIEPEVLTIEDQ